MTRWPSKKEIKQVLKELENVEGSRMLDPDASPADRLKFAICKQLILYRRQQNITQRELAKRLGIDEALMSKLLHYWFDDFTVDRLLGYLSVLFPRVEIKLLLKSKKDVA